MIDKLVNFIRPTQSTVYDTESLTTLESIGKVIEKVNNCIENFNNLEIKTTNDYNNFLNQIKEYKEYCKELIQSYYNNVNATIEEFKHLIELLNGIDEVVRYVEVQSKFVQDLAKQNQDAIDSASVANKKDINEIKESVTLIDNVIQGISIFVDDSSKIQSAIDNFTGKGVLRFAQGKEYTINSKIIINKEIFIDGNNSTIITDFNKINSEVFAISGNNITIKNFNFIGSGEITELTYRGFIKSTGENTLIENCKFQNGTQGVHFSSSLCKNSTVRNCYSKNCYGSGFINLGGYYNNIENCIAESCGDGAISLFNSQYSKVTNCTVLTSDQGITIDAGSFSNIISGNTVIGDKKGTNAKSGYYGIDLKNNSHSNLIVGNTVSGVIVGIACRYGDSLQQNPSSNNIVVSNTITEISGKTITNNSYGVLVDAQYGCSILDNNINRCEGININCINNNIYNKNIIIKGNNINLHGVNFGSLPYKSINKTAINASGITNIKIENNIIQNPPETMNNYSITINNCSNFVINNNTIDNITYRAINVNGESYGEINNNQFTNKGNKIMEMYLQNTGYIKISNNLQTGSNCGYFILAENEANIYTENNRFTSDQIDSINCKGEVRNLNNENLSLTGFKGGQLRYSNKLEYFNGSWNEV